MESVENVERFGLMLVRDCEGKKIDKERPNMRELVIQSLQDTVQKASKKRTSI